MAEIRRIEQDELPQAAEVLARAFFQDPLQRYTFPDDDERAAKSPLHLAAALNYGFKYGEIYTADTVPGASIWLKPGETDMTPERSEAAGMMTLPQEIGEDAFNRFFGALAYAEEFHKTDVPEPHWYTMVIGVDPERQGEGLGKLLMQPIIDRASADGLPIYLETAQPKNVSFYKKLGFSVLRDLVEPSSGIPMWTFRKDPA